MTVSKKTAGVGLAAVSAVSLVDTVVQAATGRFFGSIFSGGLALASGAFAAENLTYEEKAAAAVAAVSASPATPAPAAAAPVAQETATA